MDKLSVAATASVPAIAVAILAGTIGQWSELVWPGVVYFSTLGIAAVFARFL